MKKKLKTKLYYILLIVYLMVTNLINAQVGVSSSNPIILSPGNTSENYSLSDTVTWFKWQNDSSSVELSINLITNGTKNHLFKLMLYTGVTTNSVYINQDSIYNIQDSLLSYRLNNLIGVNNYWIKVVTIDNGCVNCIAPLFPSINFKTNNVSLFCGLYGSQCQLIANGDFEAFTGSCPLFSWNGHAGNGLNACDWFCMQPVGADYYNSCAPNSPLNFSVNSTLSFSSNNIGTMAPHSGNGYVGLYTYAVAGANTSVNGYREYINQPLSNPMIAGRTYILGMWVRLAHFSKYAVANLHMNLGGSIISFTNQPITNKNGWTYLTSCFTAPTNINNLEIGNYDLNGSPALNVIDLDPAPSVWNYGYGSGEHDFVSYYYIDDVSIVPLIADAGPDVSICPGQSSTLSSSVSCVPQGATVSYSWLPTTGLSTPNSSVTIANPSTTTNYIVKAIVTYTNPDGSISVCTTSDVVNVAVINNNFSLTASANPNPICAGNTVTLSTNGGGNLTYNWSTGNSSFSGYQPVITASVSTIFTVTTINSCNNPLTATVSLVVSPSPNFSISATSLCTGYSASISASPNTNITTINWGYPNPLNPLTIQNHYTFNTAGSYSLYVEAYDIPTGGCNTTTIIPISVLDPVPATLTYTSLPCSLNYTFTASVGCVGGVYNYSFNVNNGSVVTNSTGIFPYSFPVSGTYTVTVYSDYDYIPSTYIIVVPPPSTLTIAITASPSNTICLGNSVNLTASGASTYTWSTGVNTSSISVTPTVNSTYTVTGTNTSGCSSTKTISIKIVPNFTLVASANPTVICPGSSSTLTATGATSYTWYPGGSTGASVVVTPTTTTQYTVSASNGTCIKTITLAVTVKSSPTVTITPSSSTVCAGSSVTLTASSGISSYTWIPCNTACNTNTFAFTAVAGSNTYSVIVTGSKGCTSSAVKTVTAIANPTLSVNSASICSGNSATLTASGASTYTWYPGATNGITLAVTPSVTTNYTVVGTNASGCTSSVVTSVYVYSNPPAPFSINAPSSVVANGTGTNSINLSTTITNTTGLSFSWFPGGANTPTTNFNLTQPEIIRLTVSNNICGSSITQSVCVNYVANTCSNTALPVLNNYTLTSPTQIANGSYFVTGTLTLDWSWDILTVASLDNKTFLMSTGSKVVIPPTGKVKIGLSSFYSCGGMWEGIELQSNATDAAQIALGGIETRIEDAYKAISCTSPLSKINMTSGVIFNKNYIDIDLSFASNPGNNFGLNYSPPIYYLSESSATSPGGNLKCSSYYTPIVKSRSYAGIKTNNVGILNYNIPTYQANYSIVKNKDYGFYFTNTNANVNNVNFNNAVGVAYSYALNFVTKPAGVGIYSENSGYLNVKPATTPTVGTTTTFTNLGYGIITNNTYSVDIQNTNHTAAAQSYTQDPAWASGDNAYIWGGSVMTAGYGLNGIFATNTRDVLRINNNNITDNYYPVTVNYTLAPSNTNTMSVAQNTIAKGANADTKEGVTFNSAISFTPVANNMRIAANTFSNVNVGVKVTSATIGLRVSTNTITLNASIGNARGIYVLGSNTVTVDNNDIKGSLTSTNVATWNVNNVGILCENSSGCKIKCNIITTAGHGIEFRGVNTSSGDGFFGNTLNYPIRRGFVLMNGGIIGTQGSSTGASANQWINGWPAPATTDPNKTSVGGTLVGGTASQAANSFLYVHNNSNELPDDNYITSPSIALDRYILSISMFTTTAGNYATCPTTLSSLRVAQSGNNNTVERDADFVNYINTVLPSTNTDVTPQDKYMLKQYMFDDLTQNPSTNSTLINFINQQQNLSVDVYHDIDSLLANGNISAASTKNANASQSNDITQTQNAYNALYMNGINSKADLDNLASIADLCPQLYGNAVYQARALLQSITYVGKEYADSCDYSNVRKEMWLDDEPKSVSVADGVQAILFPNPNNGSFTLAYDLKIHNGAKVSIYDISGKLMYIKTIDNLENRITINTLNLNNGIYFIQLSNDTKLLWTDKLVIQK